MMSAVTYVILSVLLVLVESRLNELKTIDDYMNICMDGKNHKSSPSPMEKRGFADFCTPWSKRSCCTPQVAEDMHLHPHWLNFNWDHCKKLSPRCREFFLIDLCFYECSPNVGPWLVKDVRKIRKERFLNVPLCQSVCSHWWDACRDEMTCLDNWSVGFNWTSGTNTCPEDKPCQPFHQIFNDSNHFCENLMGNSFKVVSDEEDCFYLWFDPQLPNPNERVARKKAAELLGLPWDENSSRTMWCGSFSLIWVAIVSLYFNFVLF